MDRGKRGDLGQPAGRVGPSRPSLWKAVGLVVLLLVAIGSVIIAVVLDPTRLDVNTLDPTLATTAQRGATGFAIVLGVFLISLVTVIPYVALSRLRYRVAGGAPAERMSPAGRDSVDGEAMSAVRDTFAG